MEKSVLDRMVLWVFCIKENGELSHGPNSDYGYFALKRMEKSVMDRMALWLFCIKALGSESEKQSQTERTNLSRIHQAIAYNTPTLRQFGKSYTAHELWSYCSLWDLFVFYFDSLLSKHELHQDQAKTLSPGLQIPLCIHSNHEKKSRYHLYVSG